MSTEESKTIWGYDAHGVLLYEDKPDYIPTQHRTKQTTSGAITAHDDGTVIIRYKDGGLTVIHPDGSRTEFEGMK